MKKITIIIIGIFTFFCSNAQIGGVYMTKYSAYSAYSVSKHSVDLETSFNFSKVTAEWDSYGVKQNIAPFFSNDIGFSAIYGISNKFESGIYIPSDVSGLSWGAKYRLIEGNVFSFATIAGVNLDFSTKNAFSDAGLGTVFTFDLSENFSTDVDFQFMSNFSDIKNNFNYGFYANLNSSYYLSFIQCIFGLNFYQTQYDNLVSQNLIFSPAFGVEPSEKYFILISFPISVYGKNDLKTVGFSFTIGFYLE